MSQLDMTTSTSSTPTDQRAPEARARLAELIDTPSPVPVSAADAEARLAFSQCMDTIEDVFKASKNPQMTRQALHTLVDMTADEAKPVVTA